MNQATFGRANSLRSWELKGEFLNESSDLWSSEFASLMGVKRFALAVTSSFFNFLL